MCSGEIEELFFNVVLNLSGVYLDDFGVSRKYVCTYFSSMCLVMIVYGLEL